MGVLGLEPPVRARTDRLQGKFEEALNGVGLASKIAMPGEHAEAGGVQTKEAESGSLSYKRF